MEFSFFGSHTKKASVFKGICGSENTVAVGKLCFYRSDSSKIITPYSKILVVTENKLPEFLSSANLCYTVGLVVLGKSVPDGFPLDIPVMNIADLSVELDSRNAILDTHNGLLYIDPDIDTVNKYFGALSQRAPLPQLNTLYKFTHTSLFTDEAASDAAVDGMLYTCSAGRDCIMRSEDELFEEYTELAESVLPKKITFLLSPAYPFESESRERFYTHAKAIARAAVYGRFRILCGGPCALFISSANKCAELLENISAELKEEEREHSNDIPVGVLVSSPLVLYSAHKLKKADFLCLRIEKLLPSCAALPNGLEISDNVLNDFFESVRTVENTAKININSILCDKLTPSDINEKLKPFTDIRNFFVRM